MMKLSDYVDINPKTQLPKGVQVPFVGMDAITAGRRKVTANERREAKGSGAKFLPGDTLFARITPCLENGKIAQFSDKDAGLGSTEFFVLRAKPNVSNQDFVFYFALQKELRDAAEKSMTGASGRQRADASALKEFECEFPSLPIQRHIAGILSAYDELIENNQRRIRILEEMARSLYREWFVHFRYPGHESVSLVDSPLGQIPQGWEVRRILDFGKVITGKTPSKANPDFYGENVPFVKTPDMHGNMFILATGECLSNAGADSQANKLIPAGAICVSCIGTIGVVSITTEDCQTNQQINSIVLGKDHFCEFLFFHLQDAKQALENLGSNGATMGNVNKSKFESVEVIAPPSGLLERYHQFSASLLSEILILSRQTANLRRTRDLLLPRLLSGQVGLANDTLPITA